EKFLPAMMSADEVKEVLKGIIATMGATQPSDMGKVMGAASKQLAGKADNKMISELVKNLLSGG
ncbi:MAG TPA: GatB/YqeY domain-containing protein, partial [Bacteroidia bacterium]|nr:GatB/YqeY domain-containing protein [Bacteroidia bacterium]